MRNKKEAIRYRKFALIGIILIAVLSFSMLIHALTPQEELSQLESELVDSGYSWLVNYSSTVGVYREDTDSLITTFDNIKDEGLYNIYLTNLYDNESYDTFDLKSGKREKISYEIIQKKMRIDEIRKELNIRYNKT